MAKIKWIPTGLLPSQGNNSHNEPNAMMNARTYGVLLMTLLGGLLLHGQDLDLESPAILTFEEYMGFVKKHHPYAKQASIKLDMAEASVLKARGAFDPKVEVDYERKKFKDTEYYDLLNTTFKIPTWYGIEFKGNFEENTGAFINPQNTLPEDGLYSAGVSLSLAQGFLINERMAALKKAKLFTQQSEADRRSMLNKLLFDASTVYFNWMEAVNEAIILRSFVDNATVRLKAVERSVEAGDKASIDITEARIILQDRILQLEAADLKRMKAALELSNYLWFESVPLELEDSVLPQAPNDNILALSQLEVDPKDIVNALTNHPILESQSAAIEGLKVDRRLLRNRLLPKVDLQYNFLSEEYEPLDQFNTANYKALLNVSFPLFLRKERGDLKLANLKLQDATFERTATEVSLQNKIESVYMEIASLERQVDLSEAMITDYGTLVAAEERKLFLGESSLFLVNSREQKLIDAQLKQNDLLAKNYIAKVTLFNVLGTLEQRVQ
ncbi:TolC family protein [Altibacter sp.]|uniref:TolC family protein n=1 Tax=Altibacter sp. TaxID=2024823 RepID=UPI0025BDC76A|nr:TolC family protein [Altibacter sp.]